MIGKVWEPHASNLIDAILESLRSFSEGAFLHGLYNLSCKLKQLALLWATTSYRSLGCLNVYPYV